MIITNTQAFEGKEFYLFSAALPGIPLPLNLEISDVTVGAKREAAFSEIDLFVYRHHRGINIMNHTVLGCSVSEKDSGLTDVHLAVFHANR